MIPDNLPGGRLGYKFRNNDELKIAVNALLDCEHLHHFYVMRDVPAIVGLSELAADEVMTKLDG